MLVEAFLWRRFLFFKYVFSFKNLSFLKYTHSLLKKKLFSKVENQLLYPEEYRIQELSSVLQILKISVLSFVPSQVLFSYRLPSFCLIIFATVIAQFYKRQIIAFLVTDFENIFTTRCKGRGFFTLVGFTREVQGI